MARAVATKSAASAEVQAVNRESIHRVARKLFSEKGFAETSMQDIAAELGLQRGSLYHHIESKDEVLLAILESSLNGILNGIERVLAGPGAPEEKLQLYLLVSLETMANRQEEMLIWIAERRRMPKLLQGLAAKVRRADHMLMTIIDEGIKTGAWAPRDKQLAYQTIRAVIAWFPHWYRPGGRLSVSEIGNEMARWAALLLRA
jgi:TetR/AcrR family transcriptional regulator, cholesterol catabolism regulator